MSWNYNGSVGYKGYAGIGKTNKKPGGPGDLTRLLATGGQISLNQDPLTSQGVWGAKYFNAAQIAWAYNYLRLEGNVSYDLTLPRLEGNTRDNTTGVWNAVKRFAFTDRTKGLWIEILPDGNNGYRGPGYCSAVSFNASEGAIVTGDLSFQGDADSSTSGAGITSSNSRGLNDSTSVSDSYFEFIDDIAGDTSLVPYWATGINSNSLSSLGDGNTGWMDIISWNCSYNADIQLLKCCKAQNLPPLGADYLVLGEMTGDGSFEVFKVADDFEPWQYQRARELSIYITDYRNRTTKGQIAGFDKDNTYLLRIPRVLVSSGSVSLQTGTSYIQSSFNFTAFGNGHQGPVKMYDSIQEALNDASRGGANSENTSVDDGD